MFDKERLELDVMARSSSLPHRQVRQAQALLRAGDGNANLENARQSEVTVVTIRAWRSRFESEGVASVGKVAPGRGRRPEIDAEVIDSIVTDTLTMVPDDGSVAWSTRTMAQRHGVSKDTVARIWRSRGLRPWKIDTFKLSTDPNFEHKVIDVVGL